MLLLLLLSSYDLLLFLLLTGAVPKVGVGKGGMEFGCGAEALPEVAFVGNTEPNPNVVKV